ncbi:hypothetical protein HCX50_15980 [Microbacterium oxydans]|uniref:hypothetical protein n=1 Tax=Microbacterium sp. B19(2022) TaxID=2914045 RepID=UPI001431F2E2|nr:hypothetical protein [Microbacterium sp. B19(2022)]NJI60929.1 hypothetical protein [Microbacterium sp. B19(2022)]
MFTERIQGLTGHINTQGAFDPSTRALLYEQLEIFQEVDRMLEPIGYPTDYHDNSFTTIGEALLDQLRDSIRSGDDEAMLGWIRTACSTLSSHVTVMHELGAVADAESRGIVSRTALVAQQATTLMDQAALRASAMLLNEELQDSVSKAKDAAGIVGNASLSRHFAAYADDEVGSANRFRVAALVGFSIALAFALLFGNGKEGWLLTFQSDWTALAFKAAGAVGIGGISAYLARQAGQHRRMANWAQSMAVQLQSFPAFIEPLGYEEQAEMYRMLARRVLTAPPERPGGAPEDNVGAAQLFDLVASLAKRSGGQTPSAP